MNLLFWTIALSIAATIIAHFGLYDFKDKPWHTAMLCAPMICVLVLIVGRSLVRQAWVNRSTSTKWWILCQAIIAIVAISSVTNHLKSEILGVHKTCNTAPYDIALAVRYMVNRLHLRTEGYWTIPSGKCQTIERSFLRQKTNFQVFAAKKDDLESWLKSTEPKHADGSKQGPAWNLDKYETLDWAHGKNIVSRSLRDASEIKSASISWKSAPKYAVLPDTSYIKSYSTGISSANDSLSLLSIDESVPSHMAPFVEAPTLSEGSNDSEVWFSRGGTNVKWEVCNLLPYQAAEAVYFQSKVSEWTIEPPLYIGPGRCEVFERNFQGVEPSLYKHTVITGEVEKWEFTAQGAPDEWRTSEGDIGKDDEAVWACAGDKMLVLNSAEEVQACRPGENHRLFIKLNNDGKPNVLYTDALPLLPEIKDGERKGEIDVEAAKRDAIELNSSLYNRMTHQKRYPSDIIRYDLGFDVAAENFLGEHLRGITVSSLRMTVTPFGVRVPVVPNEQIIGFNGDPIFSKEDLDIALIKFAESKDYGIKAPYKVNVLRGNETFYREGYFFFNEQAYTRSDTDYQKAYIWGRMVGTSLLGNPVRRNCEDNPGKDCEWEKTQEFWRLIQMYPDAYEAGRSRGTLYQGIATFVLVPPVLKIARLALGLRRASTAVTVASEAAATIALTSAEYAAIAAYEAPPGSDVNKQMREQAKLGAKIGLASLITSSAASQLKLPIKKSVR